MSFNKKLPDPHELKGLRQRAKIDLNDLATQTELTTAQLTQLEQGGRHLFYSEEIRKQAILRILKVLDPANSYLENEKNSTDSTGTKVSSPSQENSHLNKEKNVIEDIVRLSAKSRNSSNYIPSSPYSRKNLSPMAWGAICVIFGIGLLYWSPWKIENLFSIPGLNSSLSTAASSLTAPQSVNSKSISSEEKSSANVPQGNVVDLSSLNVNPTPILGSNSSEISSEQTKGTQNQTLTSASVDSQNKPTTAPSSSSPSQINSSVISTPQSSSSSTSSTSFTSSTATTPPFSANSVSKISTEPTTDPCQLLGSDAPSAPLAAYPSKAGNYVYLISPDITQACVQDATGKKSLVRLQKDQGTSIYGKAPWQIAGPDIQKIQIYFQGARINTSAISGQRILLMEQNITQ